MRSFLKITFFMICSITFFAANAQIIYVDGGLSDTTSVRDGSSWETAYATLGEAIENSQPNSEIWMSGGLYLNPTNGDTSLSYIIEHSLTIRGGFNGELNERDRSGNVETLLNGDSTKSVIRKIFDFMSYEIEFELEGLVFDRTQTLILKTENYHPHSVNLKNLILKNNNRLLFWVYPAIEDIIVLDGIACEYNSEEIFRNSEFGSIEVKNSIFRYNTNTFAIHSRYSYLSVYNSLFKNNNLKNLFFVGSNSIFLNCKFFNNVYNTMMRSASMGSHKIEFLNCNFINDSCTENYIDNQIPIDITLENCEFYNVHVGNGVFNGQYRSFISNNSLFQNCSGTGYYSLIDNQHTFGITKVNNTQFLHNQFAHRLISSSSDLTIENSLFDKNIVNSYNQFLSHALIMNGGGDVTIRNTDIISTNTNGSIVNVSSADKFVLKESNIESNISKTENSNLLKVISDTISISSSSIKGNEFESSLFSLQGFVNLDNLEIEDNVSKGSLMSSQGFQLSINNSSIKNNSVLEGECFWRSTTGFDMRNCLVSKNVCEINTGYRAAFLILNDKNGIYNSTVSNNDFNQASLFAVSAPTNQPVTIRNSIVYSNNLRSKFYSNSSISYTIQNSNTQEPVPGLNNLSVDPMFVDPENGDFRLSCQSPLINKGFNGYAPEGTDLAGNPRIVANTVDIGAYEFQGDPNVANAVAVPDFSFNNSACRTEPIIFDNITDNKTYFDYTWRYGEDDAVSNSIEGAYAYDSSGTYDVELVATNACGQSFSTSKEINIRSAFIPSISHKAVVCPGDTLEFTTDATCTNLNWTVSGGNILSGQGTSAITALFGNGAVENASVALNATECGNSNVCEFPVGIEIPIFSNNLEIVATQAEACQGETNSYSLLKRALVPGAIYTWSTSNGTIAGNSSGYGLDSIEVEWDATADTGWVKVESSHELLDCDGGVDSIMILLRPRFAIVDEEQVCGNSIVDFDTDQAGDFTWRINGQANTIDAITGEVTFGKSSGIYSVIAEAIDPLEFCNIFDTSFVSVFYPSEVDSIVGVRLVDTIQMYTYVAETQDEIENFNWIVNGGSIVSSNNVRELEVVWDSSEPFELAVQSTNAISNETCYSDTFTVALEKDLTFVIDGPDEVCFGDTAIFQTNLEYNPEFTYEWTLDDEVLPFDKDSAVVIFDQQGYRYLDLKIIRSEKTYSPSKTVRVNTIPSGIAIEGEDYIATDAVGQYDYGIINPRNLNLDIQVIGASIQSVNDTSIIIEWDQNGPYEIVIVGTNDLDECATLPVRKEIERAEEFVPQINLVSNNSCLNGTSTYSLNADEYVKNIEWQLSAGGLITSNSGNSVTIDYLNSPGNYELAVSYYRFVSSSYDTTISILPLPQPEISDITICGDEEVLLSTMDQYESYEWTFEPSGVFVSDLANPAIEESGYYKVEVIDVNGCEGSTSKRIPFLPLPRANIQVEGKTRYCEGDININTQFNTFEGNSYTYQWYRNDTLIEDAISTSYQPEINTDSAHIGEYYVQVTSDICESVSDVQRIVIRTTEECNNDGGGNNNGGDSTCTDFVNFDVTGCQPFIFSNVSTSGSDYIWNFGDGTTSNQEIPVPKTYGDIGSYSITLKSGCKTQRETVVVPVLAVYTIPEIACLNDTITFEDYSVNIYGGKITGWIWDFGDGETIEGTGNFVENISHQYTDSGTYVTSLTVFGENVNGGECAHTATKELIVNGLPDVGFSIVPPACDGKVYSFINESSQNTQDAQYVWDLGNGETSTKENSLATYNVYEETAISLTVTDYTTCSNNLSKPFTPTPPVVKKPITSSGNIDICLGDSVILTSPTSTGTYIWMRDTTELQSSSQDLTVGQSGNYWVKYEESGCQVISDSVFVDVFTTSSEIVVLDSLCEGNDVELQVSNTVRYLHGIEWKKDDLSLSSSSESLLLNDFSSDDEGTYSVTLTELSSGCTYDVPSINIELKSNPSKPVISSENSIACYNSDITVKYDNSVSNTVNTWYEGINTVITATLDSIELEAITSDKNIQLVVLDTLTGCTSSSDVLNIAVGPQVQFSLGADRELCEGKSLEYETNLDNDIFDFQWYRDDSLLSATSPTLTLPTITLSDSGYYFVKVSTNSTSSISGCEYFSDSSRLSIKRGPQKPEIIGETSFCEGSTLNLSTNELENFEWSTGETNQQITVYQPGTYRLSVEDTVTGCRSTSLVEVEQNPLPNFNFLATGYYELCASEDITFMALNDFSSYQWKFYGEEYGRPSTDLYPRKSGNYTVEVETFDGCVAESDTLRITSLPCACTVVSELDDIGVGSLRDAIICANSKPGVDFIHFDIDGDGPFTIVLDSALPIIEEAVVIDGFSQSEENLYEIELEAGNYNRHGLEFTGSSETAEIRGLVFKRFDEAVTFGSSAEETLIEKNVFENNNVAVRFLGFDRNTTIHNNRFRGGTALYLRNSEEGAISNNYFTNHRRAINGSGLQGILINENAFTSTTEPLYLKNNNRNVTIDENRFYTLQGDALYLDGISNSIISNNTFGLDSNDQLANITERAINLQFADSVEISDNLFVALGYHVIDVVNSSSLIIQSNQFGLLNTSQTFGNNGFAVRADSMLSSSFVGNEIVYTGGVNGSISNSKIADNSFGISSEDTNAIQTEGIYLSGSNNLIENNSIVSLDSNSIYVEEGSGNMIIKNVLLADGIGINHDELSNANRSIAHLPPTVQKAFVVGNNVIIEGKSYPGDYVHIYAGNGKMGNTIAFSGVVPVLNDSTWSTQLSKTSLPVFNDEVALLATTTDSSGNTSELSPIVRLNPEDDCLTVTNTSDSGTGSLRSAIECANLTRASDVIKFSIPDESVIQLNDRLPIISSPLSIVDDSRSIVLDGGDKSNIGFHFITNYPDANSTVEGLTFTGFDRGVQIQNDSSIFLINENLFYGNRHAVYISYSASNTVIQDNHIVNGDNGIYVGPVSDHITIRNNTIDTVTNIGFEVYSASSDIVLRNNVISSAGNAGIHFYAYSENHLVKGNSIGVEGGIGNHGIFVDQNVTNIVFDGNTIGNSNYGIELIGGSSDVEFYNNSIGVSATEGPIPNNSGIVMNNGVYDVRIGHIDSSANVISNNREFGLKLDLAADTITIENILVHSNGFDNIGEYHRKMESETVWFNQNKKVPNIIYKERIGDSYKLTVYGDKKDSAIQLYYADEILASTVEFIDQPFTRINDTIWEAIVESPENSIFSVIGTDSSGKSSPIGKDVSECIVVTNSASEGWNTLRDAIECANYYPDKNDISFIINESDSIKLIEKLPVVNHPVKINRIDNNKINIVSYEADRGIQFNGADSSEIYNISYHGFGIGLEILNQSDYFNLNQLNFYSCGVGVQAQRANNWVLDKNNYIDCQTGIGVVSGSNLNIENCVFNNVNNGIRSGVDTNQILNNQFRGGNYGIRNGFGGVFGTSYHIFKNYFDGLDSYSIDLVRSSGSTKVVENYFGLDSITGALNVEFSGGKIAIGDSTSGNYFYTINDDAIQVSNSASELIIQNNFIGINQINSSGIKVDQSNADIISNTIGNCSNNGIDAVQSTSIETNVYNNFIGQDSLGNPLPNQGYGVYARYVSSIGGVYDSLGNNFGKNVLGQIDADQVELIGHNHFGSDSIENTVGIVTGQVDYIYRNEFVNHDSVSIIVSGPQNHISKNTFRNNAKAIDIFSLDGNSEKAAPDSINLKISSREKVSVRGRALPTDTVEIFYTDGSQQTATQYIGKTITNSDSTWEFQISSATQDLSKSFYIVTTAIDINGNTSELSDSVFFIGFENCSLVTNTMNAGIGSLRNAIECANEVEGYDTIVFDINGASPAIITIDNPITITDGLRLSSDKDVTIVPSIDTIDLLIFDGNVNNTTVNGLNFNNGKTAIISRSESSNINITNCSFEQNRTASEINFATNFQYSDNTISECKNGLLFNEGAASSIRDNSFENSDSILVNIKRSDDVRISDNILNNSSGKYMKAEYSKLIIENNAFIGTQTSSALGLELDSVYQSSITNNTFTNLDSNAIFSNGFSEGLIEGNVITNSKGIEGNFNASQFNNNVIGTDTAYIDDVGIDIHYGARNRIYQNEIYTIDSNAIYVRSGNENYIDENILISDSIGINLNETVNANQSVNHIPPTIDGAYSLEDNSVLLEGTSYSNDTIHVYFGNGNEGNTIAFVGTTVVPVNGSWSITVSAQDLLNDTLNYFLATTTDDVGNTTEFSNVVFVTNSICTVTSNANDGEGTLRAAFDNVNSGVCRIIDFDINNSEINLVSSLPILERQTNIFGNATISVLGQSSLNGVNFEMDFSSIEQLSFGQFDKAIELSSNRNKVSDINVDQSNTPLQIDGDQNSINSVVINGENENDRSIRSRFGIDITGSGNRIESSKIVKTDSASIVINGGINNTLTSNIIYDSPKAIAHQNNGNNNYEAPTDIIAEYLNESTEDAEISGVAEPGDLIQVFLSDYTGKGAFELVTQTTTASGTWSLPIPQEYTNLNENVFFVVTATSNDGSTSELSGPVKLGDNAMYCIVTNTENEGEGSFREAVNCANLAGTGAGARAIIVFDLPVDEFEIPVEGQGFVLNNTYGITIDPEDQPISISNSDVTQGFDLKGRTEIFDMHVEGFEKAFAITSGNDHNLHDNNFVNNDTSVHLTSGYIVLNNNEIKSGTLGALIENGSARIEYNQFGTDASRLDQGILVRTTNGIDIQRNTFSKLGDTSSLDTLSGRAINVSSSRNGMIKYNTISSKTTAISLSDIQNFSVTHDTVYGGVTAIEIVNSINSSVQFNTFSNLNHAGIELKSSENIHLSQNVARNMEPGSSPIIINYDQVEESNDGMPMPEFQYATYSNGQLALTGFAEPFSRVEIFTTSENGLDLTDYVTTVGTDEEGLFVFRKSVAATAINDESYRATSSRYAIFGNADDNKYPNTSEASFSYNPNIKLCYVLSNSDEDIKGTLRYNIGLSNRDSCNLMLFDIQSSSKIITLTEPLPTVLNGDLTIDATSQEGFTNSPIVFVEDGSETLGFEVALDSGGFFIHGLGMNGFERSIQMNDYNYLEITQSSLKGFAEESVDLNNSKADFSFIRDSEISSSMSAYALNLDQPNVRVFNNKISGGSQNTLLVQSDSILIESNEFVQNETTSGYAVKIDQADSVYLFDNKIINNEYGISIENSLRVTANSSEIFKDTSTLDSVLTIGIHVLNSPRTDVYSNIISIADTAIIVENSLASEIVSNYAIDTIHGAGIVCRQSDSLKISSNVLLAERIGIQINNSSALNLYDNTVYGYDSVGVIVDSLSNNTWLRNNTIGASSTFTGQKKSKGAGVAIYSSDNLIGGDTAHTNYILNNVNGGLHIYGQQNKITYNHIFDNDTASTQPVHFAILHIDSGNVNKAAPYIEGNEVLDTGRFLVSGIAEPNDSIHLYRAEGHYQNARYYVERTLADADGNWTVEVDTANLRDELEYITLTLVATATDSLGNTSQLSNMVYVGDCYTGNDLDTTDNFYPIPNSFRQAVTCANSQEHGVGMYFAIPSPQNEAEIALTREMIPLQNKYGVDFDGTNLLRPEQVTVYKSYFYQMPDSTVFWRIADSVQNSSFSNLTMKYFDSTMVFLADSNIEISGMEFLNINEVGILLDDSVSNYTISNNLMNNSFDATMVRSHGARNISLVGNEWRNSNHAFVFNSADSLRISNNTINIALNDPILVTNSKHVRVDYNEFTNIDSLSNVWVEDVYHLSIDNNSFSRNSKGVSVIIKNVDSLKLNSNTLIESNIGFDLEEIHHGEILENSWISSKKSLAKIQDSDSINIAFNKAARIDSIGYDIIRSNAIKLSQNLVTSVGDSNLQLINIHLDQADSSNAQKPAPVFGEFLVKLENTDGECSKDSNRLGIYLRGTSEPFDSIEVFFSDTIYTTFNEYVVTGAADSLGIWEVRLPEEYYERDTAHLYSFTATATDSLWNTSQEAIPYRFDNVTNDILVKTTANDGPNSLRDAINRVNCSDLHTKVIFAIDLEPAPYIIELQDSLPVINALVGFTMDASGTQSAFHEEMGIAGDSNIYINASAFPVEESLFTFHKEGDWNELSNFHILNTNRPFAVYNNENELSNITIQFDGDSLGDTAFVDHGSGANVISNFTVSGYEKGFYLANGGGNRISSSSFSGNDISVEIRNGKGNIVERSHFLDDSLSILLQNVEQANFIQGNQFGTEESPISKTAVYLVNAQSQYITSNYFPKLINENQDSLIGAIHLSNGANNNQIIENTFGIDADGYSPYVSSMTPIVLDGADSLIINNSITDNQMAGLDVPGIILRNTSSVSIAGNFLGVDTMYVQRNDREDYSTISGIDTSAILVLDSRNTEIRSNRMINFGVHALDIRNSENVNMRGNQMFSEKSSLKAIQLNQETDSASNVGTNKPTVLADTLININQIEIRGASDYSFADIQIFEGFAYENERPNHSLRYIKTVKTDADGNWTTDLPTENFGFSKYNKYIAQVNNGNASSELSDLYYLDPLLCKFKDAQIDLLGAYFDPCPQSQFTIDAQLENLNYAWYIEGDATFDTIRTKVASIDTSADFTLRISDDNGCEHIEEFEINYKPTPQKPEFILSSNTFVDDTITLIDVSDRQPESYDWSSTDGLIIVEDTIAPMEIIGPDGKVYPEGRFVSFIAPDSGTYVMTQRSLLNGCFVSEAKEINVTYKDFSEENPYEFDPGINSLSVYPNPIRAGETGIIEVTSTGDEEITLSIIPMIGNAIFTTLIEGEQTYSISFPIPENTPSGVYIIKFEKPSAVLTQKIIITGKSQ